MSSKLDGRTRGQLLKALREEHQQGVAWAQAYLKEQNATRRQICKVLREGPKTIPEIAEAVDMPADQVLWHVTAMKKYDLVEEAGMCGEYFQYRMAEDK
jgi:predicted transcriptional regulator